MRRTPFTHRARSARLLAALCASAVLLGACGGDDPDPSGDAIGELMEDMESMEDMENSEDMGGTGGDTGSDDEEPAQPELLGPNFLLPAEADVPSGFEMLPARCEPPTGEGTWITYAVPEDWENTSRGSGGSGSPLSTGTTLGFARPDGGDVSVDVDPENRHPDGTILDSSGGEWESFDYEITRYSSDEESTTEVSFESRGSVSVGEQDVEIMLADQAQAPEELGRTEAKARVEAAELPNPAIGDDDKLAPASYVVTIAWDAEDGDLDDGTMGTILRTMTMPECTRAAIVTQQEVRFGEDLDGDGEVATVEDLIG